jgi:hypothetical protein
MGWGIAEDDELLLLERQLGVCAALVVGEFNVENARRQGFHDGADLATNQAALGMVLKESDNVEELGLIRHRILLEHVTGCQS